MLVHRVLMGAVLVTSCVKSSSIECGDGIVCPSDTTCDLDRGLCIAPGQLEACDGKAEGVECTFDQVAGACYMGLCTMSTCGDMRVGPGEVCDDGNLTSGDGCRGDCRSDESCGNGTIDYVLGEECDCGATATAPGCASVNSLESDVSTCRPDCKARCGDGDVQPGELCDGAPAAGETCLDYGFDVGNLGCTSICTPALARCEQFGWVTVDTGVSNPRLNAVWGVNPDDVFAVGDSGLILRWNGIEWTQMTVPMGSSHLSGVWGRSASDVYAVGTGGAILHFDGTAWATVASGTTEPLFAVHGDGTRVIAVGGNVSAALITESVGGGAFTASTFPGYADLHAVLVHGGKATAVGRYGADCHRPSTSSAWGCANAASGFGDFTSLAVLGSVIYAGCTNGLYKTTTPSDVNQFSKTTIREFGQVESLTTIGTSLIVGGDRMFRFDGTSGWYQISDGSVPHHGVWAAALNDMWGVGLGARHFSGTTWSFAPTGATDDLNSIDAGPIGVFAAGGSGRITTFVDGAWASANTGTSSDFIAISVGSDAVVALESNGNLMRSFTSPYNVFGEFTMSATVTFLDLWIKDQAHDAFALSANGRVFRTAVSGGSVWTETSPGLTTNVAMNSIWGSSDVDIFVAGGSGIVHHWNGSSWTQMSTGAMYELRDIHGSSSSDVWAVGQMGAIVHYDGSTWTKHESGTFNTLESVWSSGPNDVFATGGDTLLHYDGTEWAPVRDATNDYMTDITGSASHVFAVGRNGGGEMLIRY